MKLSAVIITHNEERNIGRCLNSLQGVVDEVIVVDSGSTDGTGQICEEKGARFVFHPWAGYAAQKNFANSLAQGEYILSLDADEVLSEELRTSIQELKNAISGTYRFNRLTNYCGHWIRHSGWYPDEKLRIFPAAGSRWTGEFVHEELELPPNTPSVKLKGDLLHYSYHSVEEHRERADKYSALTAKKMFAAGKRSSLLKAYLSGWSRWLKMAILQLGLLDGWAGRKIASVSAASNVFKYKELRRLQRLPGLRKELKTILIARTDSIGDVMLSLPLAGVIREELPDVRIVFIGRTYTGPVIRCCEAVDEFLNMDELQGMSETDRLTALKGLSADLIIHAFPDKQLVKWAKEAGIPLRLATGKRWHTLWHCNRLTWFSRKASPLHESQLNLRMLGKVGLRDRMPLGEVYQYARFTRIPVLPERITALLDPNKKKILLHPKSKGSAVEWGLASFSRLAQLLSAQGVQVIITGTGAERQLIGDALPWNDPNLLDLCGKMDLNELIALISRSDGLVAASTGPLHIAAAVGIRAVGLYSPRRPMHPGRWSPLGPKAIYLVAPRHPTEHEFLEIEPVEVLKWVLG